MNTYRYLGLKIESDFPLIQLPEDHSDSPVDVHFEKDPTVSDRVSEAIKDQPHTYIIDRKHTYFRNLTLDFEAIDGKLVRYMPSTHERSKYTLNCLTGWASAMILLQRGQLGMHGSVVEKDGRAFLISGVSGAGKSTVASYLLKNGYHLIADDMTAIHLAEDGSMAVAEPAFPYQKLCRDAAVAIDPELTDMIYIDEDKDKFFVPKHDIFIDHATPMAGMVHLGINSHLPEGSVLSSPLTGLDQFMCVSFDTFLRPLLRDDRFQPEIGSLALALAGKLPIRQITRSATGNTLDAVIAAVKCFLNE